jgi:hypothetical protein
MKSSNSEETTIQGKIRSMSWSSHERILALKGYKIDNIISFIVNTIIE